MGQPPASRSKVTMQLTVQDDSKGIEIYEVVLVEGRYTARLEGWGKRPRDGHSQCKWWRWALVDNQEQTEKRSLQNYLNREKAKMLLVREITLTLAGGRRQ